MKVKRTYHNAISIILLQLIVFFYIYSVPLKGLPAGIGSRILFTLFGMVLLSIQVLKDHVTGNIRIHREIILLSLLIILLALVSGFSMFVNATNDASFIKYAGSFIYMLLSGYFVVWAFKKVYKEPSFYVVGNYVIIAGLMQVLISLGMFLSPALYNILIGIQNIDELTDERLSGFTSFRLVGFGSNFFGSGIVHGYMLFLLATLLRVRRHKPAMIFFYAVAFILLFVLGTMMARTTLIGMIMALALLFWPSSITRITISKSVFKFLGSLLVILMLMGSMVFLLSKESRELLSNATEFGFELFINYAQGEGVKSASTDELKDMFIWPENLSTYVTGDGYYMNPLDPARYYMGTDVGYLRLIYYFGIPGAIVYLLIQFLPIAVCSYINRHNHFLLRFFICSFIFLLTLNVKGFTDTFYLSILFYYIIRYKCADQNINHQYEAAS